MGNAQRLGDVSPVGLEVPLQLALVAVTIEAFVVLEERGAGSERDDEPRSGLRLVDAEGGKETERTEQEWGVDTFT